MQIHWLVVIALLPALRARDNGVDASMSTGEGAKKGKLKVVVTSVASFYSHMQFQGRLANLLAEAGHKVDLLLFEYNPLLANYSGVDERLVRVIRVSRPSSIAMRKDVRPPTKLQHFNNLFGTGGAQIPLFSSELLALYEAHCDEVVSQASVEDGLISALAAEHYDVGLSEFHRYCYFGLLYAAGVPLQIASSAMLLDATGYSLLGLPSMPSWTPNLWAPPLKASDGGPLLCDFWHRAKALYFEAYDYFIARPRLFHALRKPFVEAFGESFPSLDSILRNVSRVFVNTHQLLELPHLSSPLIVYVGGIANNLTTPNSPQEVLTDPRMRELVDGNGQIGDKPMKLTNKSRRFVLFAFGGGIDTSAAMPLAMKRSIITTLANFSRTHDFIWKYKMSADDRDLFAGHIADSDEAPGSTNIHLFDWVEQPALLNHPRMHAFITHCGPNSVWEAIAAGVPMLAVPLVSDEFYTAAVILKHGIGVYLPAPLLADEQAFGAALEELLEEKKSEKYRVNIKRLREQIRQWPSPAPAEVFVKEVEYVAAAFAHDPQQANELGAIYAEMNTLAYYSLDVLLFIGATLALVAVIAAGSIVVCARFCVWAWAKYAMYSHCKQEKAE